MDTIDIVQAAWAGPYCAALLTWSFGTILRVRMAGRTSPPRWAEVLIRGKREIHPFIPFAILINLLIVNWDQGWGDDMFNIVIAAWALIGWFLDKDDDDRWKRRRKKLAEKVSVRGGKLVTVGVR
jgi:hypothetical protein